MVVRKIRAALAHERRHCGTARLRQRRAYVDGLREVVCRRLTLWAVESLRDVISYADG